MRIVLTRREALDVPDGINIFLFTLADALIAAGHQVALVSTFTPDLAQIKMFYKLERWPEIFALSTETKVCYSRALPIWLMKGKRVIGSLQPDLVLVNGAVPLKLPGVTCTISHDAENRLAKYPALRALFKRYSYSRSDFVCATCDEVRQALSEEATIQLEKIAVIPTCVKLDTYVDRPYEERQEAILHMGTVDYKNPDSTIAGFCGVARSGRKLYITGKVDERLRRRIAGLEPSVRSRIELLGYVSSEQLLNLLGSVRVVSVPSIYAVPVASPTVIESLASGTPVVASKSISAVVLRDGWNGYVCDPHDKSAMGDAYERLLSHEVEWKRLAANAKESSRAFSSHRIAGMYLNTYTKTHAYT